VSSIKKRVWLKKQNDRTRVPSSVQSTMGFDYDNADTAWSCSRKKAYTEESFARRVAQRMRDERDADVVVYACRHCGSYHIGRAPSI
jgi:hypothetical protein